MRELPQFCCVIAMCKCERIRMLPYKIADPPGDSVQLLNLVNIL